MSAQTPQNRLGTYVTSTVTGETVRAFIPPPLPPVPELQLNGLLQYLDRANQGLGRLNGMTKLLPDIRFLLYLYVRKEALVSSQIEGTQSSFADLLLYENEAKPHVPVEDVEEVSNYVAAMQHGLKRLKGGFPLSLRLIREIHAILLRGGRGANKMPGEFRRSQNWIGGTRPGNASFVPPPPERLMECLNEFENFLHDDKHKLPVLLEAGLVHVQFESIHPFLDGNGRIGRLLVAALMEQWGLLREPLMYLSGYLKQHQDEYYRRLSAIRGEGDWEGWVSFFLEGVAAASAAAERGIIDVASLITADRKQLLESAKAGPVSYRLFELLPMMPRFSVEHVRRRLETTFPTASAAVKLLEYLGIVAELTGQKKNRVYSYQAYVGLLSR